MESAATIDWSWQGQSLRLGATRLGAGPTLLLLPALSSISTREEMRPLQELLSASHATVSIDWPGFGDQPFWGQRVHDLGAGPRPILAKRLTADALGDAIRQTASADMRRRTADLGERIRAEDGVARAVDAIEHHLERRSSRRVASAGWGR